MSDSDLPALPEKLDGAEPRTHGGYRSGSSSRFLYESPCATPGEHPASSLLTRS